MPPPMNPENRHATHTGPEFLFLRRNIEMYQWIEQKSTETVNKWGGSQDKKDVYLYKKDWSGLHNNSARFQIQQNHENPPQWPCDSQTLLPGSLRLGPFNLAPDIIQNLPKRCKVHDFDIIFNDKKISSDGEGFFYINFENNAPKIGDVRVSFNAITRPQHVSIIGKQSGKTIGTFTSSGTGQSVSPILHEGKKTSSLMFEEEEAKMGAVTGIIRVAGFVVNYIGWDLLFTPLVTTTSIIPVLASLSGIGVALVAIPLAVSTSGLTIVFAWVDARVYYRIFQYPLRVGYAASMYLAISAIGRGVAGYLSSAGSAITNLVKRT